MVLIFLSFVAGLLTVLAPCVLPLLPIILLWSLEEKWWRRPLIIISSLCISIVVFTIILKVSTLFLWIPEYIWKYISWWIIILLGLIYLFPKVWQTIGTTLNTTKSHSLLQSSQNITSKNFQAIATGATLWPVFSSCSPTYAFIIATVFPLSLFEWIFYTSIYALGIGSLFFLIALFGQTIIKKLRIFADENWIFHKIIWITFLIVGIAIISGYDKQLESKMLDIVNTAPIEQNIFDKINPQKK